MVAGDVWGGDAAERGVTCERLDDEGNLVGVEPEQREKRLRMAMGIGWGEDVPLARLFNVGDFGCQPDARGHD
jgi:hypothetical protein